jgi:GNAT superfamily N-acetyltransferase
LLVEPISRSHARKRFDCGDKEVTRFLQEQALQDQERDLSRTMVLVDEQVEPTRIVGYHTLLMAQVKQEEIPGDRPRIKRAIPVILLGQLGIDREFQDRGYGELMLMDAQARVDEISRKTGVRAMMLDARNERLALWYESYDFIRFPDQFRMFKSIDVTLPKCLPPQEAKDCREDLQITRFLLTSKTTARENGSIRLPKVQFGSNGLPKVKVVTTPPAQPQPEFEASLPKAK